LVDVGSPVGGGAPEGGFASELERESACDGGRVVDFYHAVGASGHLTRVVADGERGFLLFGPNHLGFTRLSPQGRFVDQLDAPYSASVAPTHGLVGADGALFLAGMRSGPWFAKIDRDWNLVWESEIDLGTVYVRTDVQPLPDGGAIVTSSRAENGPMYDDTGDDDVVVARVDANGALVWRRDFSFERVHFFSEGRGSRMLALNGRGLHLAVAADAGVFLLSISLDGEVDEATQSTPLPESVRSFERLSHKELVGVEALPDDELAIYSSHRLTIVDANGGVRLTHKLSDGHYIDAVRFDAARGQLVMIGEYLDIHATQLPAPWISAIDLNGDGAWQMLRPSVAYEGDSAWVGPEGSGPPLDDGAIDSHGNMLVTGQIGRGLEYVWVGEGACQD
jgi:hypothetical protein